MSVGCYSETIKHIGTLHTEVGSQYILFFSCSIIVYVELHFELTIVLSVGHILCHFFAKVYVSLHNICKDFGVCAACPWPWPCPCIESDFLVSAIKVVIV